MTSSNVTADAFSQFDELTNRRSALEKLIDIAIGIQSQQQALEDLALIARPSQEFPVKIATDLQELEDKYAGLTDTRLAEHLEAIEQATHKVIEKITVFARLGIQELRDSEAKELSVDGFKRLVADFEQRTQTSLALRFLLKKRGMVLAPFKLPFPQESIAEQVQALREKEAHCVAQIKAEANSIIQDTQALLAKASYPDKMKQQLLSVQQAMEINLEHLNSGGSVATIPNKFEVIVLQSDSPANNDPQPAPTTPDAAPSPSEPAPSSKAPPALQPRQSPTNPESPTLKKKLTTFQLIIRWLTTPLGISWKSLKEQNESKGS